MRVQMDFSPSYPIYHTSIGMLKTPEMLSSTASTIPNRTGSISCRFLLITALLELLLMILVRDLDLCRKTVYQTILSRPPRIVEGSSLMVARRGCLKRLDRIARVGCSGWRSLNELSSLLIHYYLLELQMLLRRAST